MPLFKSFAITNFVGMLVFGLTIATAQATVSLSTNGNELLGINGLFVGDTQYNVIFDDRNCIQIWTGCDSVTDFDFQTLEDANAAATSLFNVMNTPQLDFWDRNPAFIFGLDAFNSFILIPYAVSDPSVFLTTYLNQAFFLGDADSDTGCAILEQCFVDRSRTGRANNVYAKFTEVSAVPEPPVLLLFGIALAGMAGISWRRKSRETT